MVERDKPMGTLNSFPELKYGVKSAAFQAAYRERHSDGKETLQAVNLAETKSGSEKE